MRIGQGLKQSRAWGAKNWGWEWAWPGLGACDASLPRSRDRSSPLQAQFTVAPRGLGLPLGIDTSDSEQPHERLPEILVVPREKTPTGAAARGNP